MPTASDTDADGLFTIQKVACLGCCTLAPVVQIDGVTYGRLTPADGRRACSTISFGSSRSAAGRAAKAIAPSGELGEIRIGLGSCCVAQGSGRVHRAIEDVLAQSGAPAVLKRVGCVGMCHQTPLVELIPAGGGPPRLFSKVGEDEAADIVLRHFKPRGMLRRAGYAASRWLDRLLTDESGDPIAQHAIDARDGPVCAFLGPQMHLATEYCGQLDPTDLDEYLRHDGFAALRQCLEELSPDEMIETIQQSGLRGRGGAGFPTGTKWAKVRAAAGAKKYVVCNGDEGDPGAFMDRMLLESFPYRIIEGMCIAAYAVGAREGFFYIRAEYPLAVVRINEALARCRERGLLGERVMGTDFRLDLSVKEGAGAFVCGEETALLASIEGRRGMPRLRPPYPAEAGLWGLPTSVNNVETYALTPWIIRHGAEAFARIGTPKSPGTKVFALAGKVRRGGLIEVPMGVTVRQIVEEIGGGVAARTLRVRTSAHGVCRLRYAASRRCRSAALPAAAFPPNWPTRPSTTKPWPRSGRSWAPAAWWCWTTATAWSISPATSSASRRTSRAASVRSAASAPGGCSTSSTASAPARASRGDLEELEQLALTVKAGSICGLGRTAPNPVLSTLRYFRHEYEEHLAGRCPAGRCKALIRYRVTDDCIGCTLCAQQCPADAIPLTPYVKHSIDQEKCTRCDTCRQVCPEECRSSSEVATTPCPS